LQELTNTVTRKFKFSYQDAINALNEVCQNNNLHVNSDKTILDACRIAQQYKFSFYDSLIIASAIESNCSVLFSEDMNNGQTIDNKIKIINPFV
jgi:predicted nucleic acid-binding protein